MDEDCIITVALALALKKQRKKRKRWIKEWYKKKNSLSHVNLMRDLRLEPCDWLNYLRMSEDAYLLLLRLVTPIVQKQDTNMRVAITAHERLSATLRFLISGSSYQNLRFHTCISAPSLCKIIPETCSAIIQVLKNYIKLPDSEVEWRKVANAFNDKWQFPNCLGAVDGKHVRIIAPTGSGSLYWNYKKFFSIVLMAIVDSNYEFLMCDVGTNGSISDGGVMNNTKFYEKLTTNRLHLPPDENVKGSTTKLPYVFVADEAFSLRRDFLKPFSRKDLNYERMVFNYRLSRARRVVENAFGILASKFRIFQSPINFKTIEQLNIAVLACCYLHNFLRRQCKQSYIIPDLSDTHSNKTIEVGGLVNLQNTTSSSILSNDPKNSRNQFVQYFTNEGKVQWQEKAVKETHFV